MGIAGCPQMESLRGGVKLCVVTGMHGLTRMGYEEQMLIGARRCTNDFEVLTAAVPKA